MPYKHNLMNVLVMLFTNPPEALRILAVMFAGGFIRWCMGMKAHGFKVLSNWTPIPGGCFW